mgnify:CR=1 FL=1
MFNFKFALLPLLILSIGLSGCTKLNKDVSKTLSIVIEPAFKEQVLDAVKYATSKNNSLEFEIKIDRKSTRQNSSHGVQSRMPSSA